MTMIKRYFQDVCRNLALSLLEMKTGLPCLQCTTSHHDGAWYTRKLESMQSTDCPRCLFILWSIAQIISYPRYLCIQKQLSVFVLFIFGCRIYCSIYIVFVHGLSSSEFLLSMYTFVLWWQTMLIKTNYFCTFDIIRSTCSSYNGTWQMGILSYIELQGHYIMIYSQKVSVVGRDPIGMSRISSV